MTHGVTVARKTLEQVLKVYKDKDALRFELHGSVNPVNVTPLHGDALAAREVIFTPVRPT